MTNLRKILEELHCKGFPKECNICHIQDGCRKEVDLAHQQILALIPKRKEERTKKLPYRIDPREWDYYTRLGFNEALEIMEQSMTGEK